MLAASLYEKLKNGAKPSDYATQSCLNPRRIQVRLVENGEYYPLHVPCGHCLRCQDNRRNDLAARMFVHSKSYNYCYFVTLTYGSYNLSKFEKHPFLNDWLTTVPVYDKHNSFDSYRWTPSLLVHSHLTKFLKRLRVSLPFPITYAACGEYGHTYCRPHFHLILWSNEPIKKDQIVDAWSLDCKRTKNKLIVRPWRGSKEYDDKYKDPDYFKFKLGNVDFEDLWLNGSLNYDGKHPGIYQVSDKHNAMHNFTYVAKYVGKTSAFNYLSNMPLFFHDRMEFAWAIYTRQYGVLEKLVPNPMDYHINLLHNIENITYENEELKEIDQLDFRQLFAPFFVSSRRPALGKLYFLENRERFVKESITMPKFRGEAVQIPSYFYRLAQQSIFPIRIRKRTFSGVSLTKDYLPRVYSYYYHLREDSNFWYYVRHNCKDKAAYRHNGEYEYLTYKHPFHGELDDIDLIDPTNSVIHYVYYPHLDYFVGYQYDNGFFHRFDYVEREEFCDYIMDLINEQYNRLGEKIKLLQIKDLIYSCIKEDPDSDIEIERFEKMRSIIQNRYNYEHPKIF